MTIKFQCENCRKEVKAPDEAGGRRGKCPFCGMSNYIPRPVSEEELLPLAPLDEAEEQRRQAEIQELFRQERDILAETGDRPGPPLEQRDDLSSADLHHYVVNYLLDMAHSNLRRAQTHVTELSKFGPLGKQAVEDFAGGQVQEPAIEEIPEKLREAFLLQLKEQLAQMPQA